MANDNEMGQGIFTMPLPIYLALKEVWRNKTRYLLISAVVALITLLVLFVAGLAEGLGAGNRELIEKLNAQLLVYQANIDLSIPSSQILWSDLRDIQRVEGVVDAGPLGFSNVTLLDGAEAAVDVTLVGVQPGKPGEPRVSRGEQLRGNRSEQVIIDSGVLVRTNLQIGDWVVIKSSLGTEEEFYELQLVGITDSRQYSIQPGIFVPYLTWEEVRPKSEPSNLNEEITFNVAAVQVAGGDANREAMAARIEAVVADVEVVDLVTAYQNTPGYRPQQSTLNTQRYFSLLIGVLVIGGFFHIQTLQKVAQVGMLKAIGASNGLIIVAAVFQIVTVNVAGVALGGLGTFILSLVFPVTIPLTFSGQSVAGALLSLLIIGPFGGVVSIKTLLQAEPLEALGLAG